MKKNLAGLSYVPRESILQTKIFRIMKLSIFLFFLFIVQLHAENILSQTATVEMKSHPQTLKDVITEIEKQTSYLFVFSEDDIDVGREVCLTTQSRVVSDILKDVLEDTDISFHFSHNYISLRKKSESHSSPFPFPQQSRIRITGVVEDDMGTIIGANILERGTSNGTISDMNGEFSLEVAPDAVLIVTYIGYIEQQIPVNGQRVINIKLQEEHQLLDEVVVTALGIKRQAKALSYSATELKGDDVGKSADANLMNSLAGKIAGVDISTLGTGIAGSSQVRIRGNTTINGDNDPLYVIDGIQISQAKVDAGGRDFGDALNTLNPNDIESITVLKGATATALYGSQAANGVILITTKKGSDSQGYGITYNGSFGFNEYVNPMRNRQTTYGTGMEGKKPDRDFNGWAYNSHQEWGAKYDGSEAYYPDNVTPVPWGYSYHGEPWDDFMRKGFFMNNSVAVTGGTAKQNYRLSISDMRLNSSIPNSDMNRQTISLNVSGDYGDRFHLDAKLDYSMMHVNNRPNTRAYVWVLGHMPTVWDVGWAKGTTSKIGADEEGNMLPWSTNEYYHNPYWAAYQNQVEDRRDRINGFVSGRFDITKWLFVTGRVGADLNVTKARIVDAYGATQFYSGTGRVMEFTSENYRFNADYSLVFNKDIKKFNINAMFGGSTTHMTYNRDGLTGTKLTIPYYHEVTNASVLETNVAYTKYGINSLYGSAEVSYDNFIYLTATGRNDWFSSLSPDNNSIFYPSVGLSYLFSQHLKTPAWISFGKLRASYAQVGGGASPYMTRFGYSLDAQGYDGYPLLSLPGTIPKSDLMPYETREWEFGGDLRLLDNRIVIDYAYYDKLTRNDIVNVSIPTSTGYNNATVNLGKVKNKGHEILLTVVPVRGRFTWDVTLTYSRNKSIVLDLGGLDELEVGSSDAGTTVKQIVGQPFYSIVGYKQAVDKASGQPIWYWNESRGIWYPQRAADPEILGTGIHPNMASFSTTLNYKGFTFSALIDGKWGGKVHSSTEGDLDARGHTKRTAKYRETGLPVEGVYQNEEGNYVPLDHDTLIPYVDNNFENYYRYAMRDLMSEFNLYDASFVKMRQLSLGYTFSRDILKKTPFKSLQITLVGRNLFNIYNGPDNVDASTLYNNGRESDNLPSTREYSLNVSVSF